MLEAFTYTGEQVAREVKVQFGDTGGVQITDADLLVWINNGQREIGAQGYFLERTLTTHLVAAQSVYDLAGLMPAGETLQAFASILANGRKVDVLAYPQYLESLNNRDIQETQGATPLIAAQYAGKLHLWPVPSEGVVNGLVIDYSVWPPDIAQLADTLTVPDRFRNALVAYVFARALEKDENFEAAERQNQLSENSLQRESERDAQNPTDFYPTLSFDPIEEW